MMQLVVVVVSWLAALPIGYVVGTELHRCPSRWHSLDGTTHRCEGVRWHGGDLHYAGRGMAACQWMNEDAKGRKS